MSLETLRAEYAHEVIGQKIFRKISELVGKVTSSYDPVVYAGTARWSEAVEDVVQSFAVEVLLEQGQLEYALFTAEDELHFRRLLARQLRFHLARTRRRTVVDNLLDRSKKITSQAPFRQVSSQKTWSYELPEISPDDRQPTSDELASLASELATIPVQAFSGADRAPQIYSTANLEKLLRHTASALGCRVSVSDLDTILRRLLTPWLPSFLESNEGELITQPEPSLDAEQRNVARTAALAIRRSCSDLEWKVLDLKLADVSDHDVGRRLGMSRPTVSKHKKQALAKVEAELTGLSDSCQSEAINALSAAIEEASEKQDET